MVELFPPSELSTLATSIERNAWDKQRIHIGILGPSSELLNKSRAGSGFSWWRLAEIASESAHFVSPEGIRDDLPPEFQAIELMAIRVGSGLTAVLAYFHIADAASRRLDEAWHTDYEPQIVRRKGRWPIVEDRTFIAYRRSQEARRSLHDSARSWLARHCPGAFARDNEPQPLMDLILLDEYDPIAKESTLDQDDALRALGLTQHKVRHCTSSALPGLLLEQPPDEALIPGLRGQPTWTLWGRKETVLNDLQDEVSMYGGGSHGIANLVYPRTRNFLVAFAISQILAITNKKLATLRDDARSRHHQFRVGGLNRLRATLLTLSVDATSMRRDIDSYYSRGWRDEGEADFIEDFSPRIIKWYEQQKDHRPQPVNLNALFKKQQVEGFGLVVSVDRDYREILSTAASLGAAASASRLGRVAVVIAIATFVVAVATLLVAKIEHNAPLAAFGRWIWSLLSG